MSKVGARSVQLEMAKSQIERTRQNAPPANQQQQEPVLSPQEHNEALHPEPDAQKRRVGSGSSAVLQRSGSFQQKVLAAANSAQAIHGINDNNARYFEMIEEAVGLRTTQQAAARLPPFPSNT